MTSSSSEAPMATPVAATFLSRPINRWWIVLGCALTSLCAAGIFAIYAVNIFFAAVVREYDWSPSATSTFLTAFFFSSGIGLLLTGDIIGRFGARKPSIIMAICYGLLVISLVFAPPSQPLFIAVFFLIGLFGAPVSALPFSIAISGYFDKNRGLAFGLGAAGAGAGSVMMPTVSNLLLEAVGWRTGILVLIGATLAIVLLSMTLLLRTPPGAVRSKAERQARHVPAYRYRDLVDRVLVMIVAMLTLNAACTIGVLGNVVPMLGERGIATSVAASMLAIAGLSSWIGRVIVGWLMDRYFAPHVATGTFILGAIGAALIYHDGAGALGFVGAMMVGISLGAEGDLAMYLVSRYFPLAAYSRAVSISWLAWAWGGGLGSFLFAQSYNLTSSFAVAMWIIIGMFAVAAYLGLIMPPYREHPSGDH